MNARAMIYWMTAGLLLASVVGCAAPRRRVQTKMPEIEVDEPFPERQELDEIEPSGDPSKFYRQRRTHVEEWELDTPLPDELGAQPREPESPWESVLAETVDAASGDVVASEGMHCLARQVGHFRLEKGAFPAGNLRDYMRTRCGVVTRNFSSVWWQWGEVPPVSEEKLAEQWREKGGDRLVEMVNRGEHRSIGIWYGQHDGEALLLVATGQRAAEVNSRPLRAEAGEGLVIEGELFDDYQRVEALRNESTFGYDRCEMDESVELPEFRIECEPNEAAERTDIQFVAFRRRRGLGRVILSTAIWDEASDDAVYRPTKAGRAVARAFNVARQGGPQQEAEEAPAGGEATAGDERASADEAPVGDGEGTEEAAASEGDETAESGESESPLASARQFAELVNQVRREAGMEPVAFESRQAEQVQRLAGRYFKAQYETNDLQTAEKIALGLIAGWRVDADIASGSMASRAVQSERAEVLLERMVAAPSGRRVLLEPEVDRVAVGLTRPADREATGVLVTAYRDFPKTSHETRASRAFETINEIREDNGASPLERDRSIDNKIEELARQVESGQLEPGEAQRQLMSVASRLWNRQVSGAWSLTYSLDELEIHDRLSRPGLERVAVMVVPYDDPDAAWTSYLVMTVFPVADGSMT